jgi:hypothetical protein
MLTASPRFDSCSKLSFVEALYEAVRAWAKVIDAVAFEIADFRGCIQEAVDRTAIASVEIYACQSNGMT